MLSPQVEQAIESALKYGKAIMKPIVPNEIPGMTGSHQYGYYLPKGAWHLYTEHPPVKGVNNETEVEVLWQDGRLTKSCVKWYGKDTRSEYRLTRFGKDFPHLTRDSVGDLLVLVPVTLTHFLGYVLETDEDIEEIQNVLGIELVGRWVAYEQGVEIKEDPKKCIERLSRKFTETLDKFPTTKVFSAETRRIISECLKDIDSRPVDKQIMEWIDGEYRLFRMVERTLCQKEVMRPFRDIDHFLETAQSILQRRKSRAGASLEHHVEHVLNASGIPFDSQPKNVDGRPDFVIPSAEAYLDLNYNTDNICILGVKTTCKDRWRQVVREGKRVEKKYILTLQKGISENQLLTMEEANVTLVVPEPIHTDYPPEYRQKILSVQNFIEIAREMTN